MGSTTSKQIEQLLETEYKPVRKYYNEFYGEVTVLQNKSSREYIAKVEKLIESTCEQVTLEHAENRRNDTTGLLVVLKAYYTCSVDMCSQNRKAVFLLEYFPLTLSQ
jgi:hypothetical protein